MLENFLIGLAVTTLGALLVYAFRARQLYVVIPRLFSVSPLSTSGKMAEIRTYNKGRSTEEDVLIALDPSLKYEVVASSDSTCALDSSAIKIPRIPPGDDFSVLLLVEGGEFSRERLSTISSKTTKGKLLSGIESVPPNAGSALLAVVSFLALMAAPVAGIHYYYEWDKATDEKIKADRLARLDYLRKEGWNNLDRYSDSMFRENYADGEFPIHQTRIARQGDIVEIQFRVVNKSAAELRLSALSEWPYKTEDPQSWDGRNIFVHKVEPQSANNLAVKLYYPRAKKGDATIEFHLSAGSDSLLTMTKRVAVDI
ncbi:hypothetical protein D3C78_609750 [compost metagenome]